MSSKSDNDEQTARAEKLDNFHRISWRQALNGLLSPAQRLHRYRELNSRLLRDTYRKPDCSDKP